MVKQREKDAWGFGQVAKYDDSPEADRARKLARDDFKFYLKHVFYHGAEDKAANLGKVHDFTIDFLRLHEIDRIDEKYCHSPIRKWCPPRNADGEFVERWLWFKTLDKDPEIQVGPVGPISQMFHETTWKGLIVRFAGDGSDKCLLLPRGHLKSTIGGEAFSTWEAVKDPSLRRILMSRRKNLALRTLQTVRKQFEANAMTQRLFGNLGPPSKGDALTWSKTAIQLKHAQARGSDPSLVVTSTSTETAGMHCDRVTLDDVVGQTNIATVELRQSLKDCVHNLEAVRDPGSHMLNIGTIWHEDDAHGEYIRPDGHSYEFTSFMVGTLRMDDDTALWREKFTEPVMKRLEDKYRNRMYFFMCQYYNQPNSAASRTFKPEWLRTFNDHPDADVRDCSSPERLAVNRRLDIYITCDPATSTKKKSDFSALIVQGQDRNTNERFVLDGFRDRLGPDVLPGAIADVLQKWKQITDAAGTRLRFGIESFGFSLYLKCALLNMLKQRGIYVEVEELKHNYRSKPDRIMVLAAPYSMGVVFFPKHLKRVAHEGGEAYDLIAKLRDELLRFNKNAIGQHDDLIDAQAYGEIFMRPALAALDAPERPAPVAKDPGVYNRDTTGERQSAASVVGSGRRVQNAGEYWRGGSRHGGYTGQDRRRLYGSVLRGLR